MIKQLKCQCCRRRFMPKGYQLSCSKKCTDRTSKLKLNYKTTPEIIHAIYKLQKGKCAICEIRGDIRELGYVKRPAFCIDHDHKTGKVRGLLCNSCNKGLGMFRDNKAALRQAIMYLIKHSPKIKVKKLHGVVMKMKFNPNYPADQRATNSKNKEINKALHVKGKKTTAKPRNKK